MKIGGVEITKRDLGFLIPWSITMAVTVVLLIFTVYKLCIVGR